MKKLKKLSLNKQMEELDKLSEEEAKMIRGGSIAPGTVSVTRFDIKDSGPGVNATIKF